MTIIDPVFAKSQLLLLLSDRYQHPNGQVAVSYFDKTWCILWSCTSVKCLCNWCMMWLLLSDTRRCECHFCHLQLHCSMLHVFVSILTNLHFQSCLNRKGNTISKHTRMSEYNENIKQCCHITVWTWCRERISEMGMLRVASNWRHCK